MVKWKIVYTNQARKDAKSAKKMGFKQKIETLLDLISINPFENPPSYEKLVGNLSGAISRRINKKHRLIYQVIKDKKIIKVIRMWTHYDK